MQTRLVVSAPGRKAQLSHVHLNIRGTCWCLDTSLHPYTKNTPSYLWCNSKPRVLGTATGPSPARSLLPQEDPANLASFFSVGPAPHLDEGGSCDTAVPASALTQSKPPCDFQTWTCTWQLWLLTEASQI